MSYDQLPPEADGFGRAAEGGSPSARETLTLLCIGPRVGDSDGGGDLEESGAPRQDDAGAEANVADARSGRSHSQSEVAAIADPRYEGAITASNGELMVLHENFVPWFKQGSWRMRACGWLHPCSSFMALGGCSLILCQGLRASCPSESFRLQHSSNRSATACFAVGVAVFWFCSIWLARALPGIIGQTEAAADAAGSADLVRDPSWSRGRQGRQTEPGSAPLHKISRRDSGKPQLLSEPAVKTLVRVGRVSHVICIVMAGWFVTIGVFSAAPLVTHQETHTFSQGTDFFPTEGCEYGSGDTIFVLRLLIAVTTAPAGVLVSLVFDMLFL